MYVNTIINITNNIYIIKFDMRHQLNVFFIISIICYSLICGCIFPIQVNLKKGKEPILNSYQLGLVAGALLAFFTAVIMVY